METMTLSSSLMSLSRRIASLSDVERLFVISEPEENLTFAFNEWSISPISVSEEGNLNSKDFRAVIRFMIQSLKLP